jgi:hypothetical protein
MTEHQMKIPRFHHRPVAAASIAVAIALAVPVALSHAQSFSHVPRVTPRQTGCSPEEREQALRAMQAEVLGSAPTELESFARALEPGGPLAGWRLSHGYVVLATAGAVAADNLDARPPLPPILLYEPSPASKPPAWLDFHGPDDPYRLVGWAYVAPYTPGSAPPRRPCIAPEEWFVHEAGWHLKDGGMHLTPGTTQEPARPAGLAIHMWHPQVWDLHVWKGENGVPTIAFANPRERRGGKELPANTFFYLVNGQKRAPATNAISGR